jgi:predicted DNA-binding ribbon-helix-helix protein
MHRTQIVLRQDQYLALKEAARGSGQSMGKLVRALVDRGLRARNNIRKRRYRLTNLKGFIHSHKLAAVHHDDVLY